MGYVQAGYTIVLSLLFLYGLQLLWRRRRLNRAVERVASLGGRATPTGAGGGPPSADGR